MTHAISFVMHLHVASVLFAALWLAQLPACRETAPESTESTESPVKPVVQISEAQTPPSASPRPPAPETSLPSMDADGDGAVSKAEFLAFHQDRMTRIFNSLDKDGSGSLSPEELGSGRPRPAPSPRSGLPDARIPTSTPRARSGAQGSPDNPGAARSAQPRARPPRTLPPLPKPDPRP